MESRAQRRANLKYRKEHTKQFSIRFYPADMDAWEYLQKQPNKNAFLKELIRADMQK